MKLIFRLIILLIAINLSSCSNKVKEVSTLKEIDQKQEMIVAYKEGIKNVLQGMNRRTNNKGQIDLAIEDLYKLDTDFDKDFESFFKDLRIFSHQKIKKLNPQNTYS